jgi:prepilin-type N-terminal cleavage/methylation domain-containing protein
MANQCEGTGTVIAINKRMRKLHALSNKKGFSLIEMLITIAIISITAMISVPFLSGFMNNRALKSAVRDVQGDIFELKERALSESRWFRMQIAGDQYTLERCANTSSPCDGYSAAFTTKQPSVFKEGITLAATVANLEFDTRGMVRPLGANSITLTNSAGSTATININQSGRTSVSWSLQ